MYETETVNVYESFYKNKELFDSSNFSKESNYFDKMNNLIAGK